MQLKISLQFANDFKMTKDVSLHEKVKKVLEKLKTAKNIKNITHFKKVDGANDVYKMGFGLYYVVAVMNSEDEMTLMRFLHRDQILETINRNL